MILLTSITDLLQLITAQAVSTIYVHASWSDYNGAQVTPGRTNTQITTIATTTIIGSPAGSTQRNVKSLTIQNGNAASSCTITVQHTDGTTVAQLVKYTLLAGETLQYFDFAGFFVLDASGGLKNSPAIGRLLRMTVLASGAGTFTTGVNTNTIKVRLVGGGAGGGNSTGNATQAAVASGGGSGGYAEKLFAVTPNTGYSYTAGGGGAAGVNGTDSSFTVSATTITAKGGTAGVAATQVNTTNLFVPGGAGGTVSTNADINGAGQPGTIGVRTPGTAAIASNSFISGSGGSSIWGGGGTGSGVAGNGVAGAGNGAGGAGGLSNTVNANNGGAGSAGLAVVEEYS